jgi:hypothetical protein
MSDEPNMSGLPESRNETPVNIRDRIAGACPEQTFFEMRCPRCAATLILRVHPNRKSFFVQCSQNATHLGIHGESANPPDWWSKHVTGGWL